MLGQGGDGGKWGGVRTEVEEGRRGQKSGKGSKRLARGAKWKGRIQVVEPLWIGIAAG